MQPIQKAEDIHLIDDRDNIQKVLGYPPGWTLRWGITAVFFSVMIFMVLARLIKYPDVIPTRVTIVTENPPIRLYAKTSGEITDLMVAHGEQVKSGQIIAVLENPAKLEDVLLLKDYLLRVANRQVSGDLLSIPLPKGLQLGSLQMPYARFEQAAQDYRFFQSQGSADQQIRSLQGQVTHLRELTDNIKQRKQKLLGELALAENNLQRQQLLYKEGVISRLALEKVETEHLRQQRQVEALQAEILNNQLQIEQVHARMADVSNTDQSSTSNKWLLIQEALQTLNSEQKQWEQTYLVHAPIEGQINMTRIWSENQFVQANETIATIVPGAGAGSIIGKAHLPILNAGKVTTGMPVNIQLDAFPHREFGILKGSIQQISLLPEQEFYTIELTLADTLMTTYGKVIPFSQELSGTARIITEDRRILVRIFEQLISILKNY